MTDINIVSTDRRFCRFLELEISRMGLSFAVSDSPMSNCRICLIDAATVSPVPTDAAVILFGGDEKALAAYRADRQLDKLFLLTDFRRALFELMSRQTAPPTKTKRRRVSPSTQLIIQTDQKTVTVGSSESIKLSETEYRLLCRLVEYGGKPLSADHAADILGTSESNKFNVYICYLRRKLERGSLRLFHTVRGQGVALTANCKFKNEEKED